MKTAERTKSTYGNVGLTSTEENAAAEYLREHFLEEANRASDPVYPKKTFIQSSENVCWIY